MSSELDAAHAAVDEAVAVLRAGRERPLTRIGKAAKDFLTEVDLAAEAALKAALAASTPDIGFFGEEGGGAALDHGRVWVADPLDGTINYATGSPLCGVMLGLLEDGVPVLGVIDLPFLGVRIDGGSVADVGAFDEAIVGLGDAFHRGGAADGRLPRARQRDPPPRAALALRRVGRGAVDLARGRADPGHGALAQQPVRRRRRPRDRARGRRGGQRLRGRAAGGSTRAERWPRCPACTASSSRSPRTSPRFT